MARGNRSRDMRWWREGDGQELASSVCQVVKSIKDDQSGRLFDLQIAARLYGDAPSLGLSPGAFSGPSGASSGRLCLNLVKTLALTARADVLEKPAPRPWFVTSGGDFDEQKKAEGLTKFVAAVLYDNLFDATDRLCSLHSGLFGNGIVHITSEDGRPLIERVYPWELHADRRDSYYGAPRTLYRDRWVDRGVLAERYPDHAEEIERASSTDPDTGNALGRDLASDQLLVVDAWHLPSGKDAGDGRRVAVIEGCTLLDEEWEDRSFPFASWAWNEPPAGFWAEGIASEVRGLQYSLNVTLERMDEAMRLCSNPRMMVDRASRVTTAHLNNEIGAVVMYSGRKPELDVARAVSPDLAQHLDRCWSKGFQVTGISELAASAMKPAGLNSGKALRVFADQSSKRFSGWGKARQDWYCEIARQIVREMRRVVKTNPDAEVIYRDAKRRKIERIRFADVMLEEESYILQCFPVSSLPSTPAGRMAALDDWLDRGLIQPDTAKRLVDMPDLEAEQNLEGAARDIVEMQIESILSEGVYQDPEEFQDAALTFKIGTQHYLRSRHTGVPEDRQELLRRYVVAAQGLMTKAQAAAQPQQPMPAAAPPEQAAASAMV